VSTKDWIEKDFYKVLGVAKDATPEDIKKAYRKLARANHPDQNPGNPAAEQRFKEISEANDVLSSESKRKEYDEARRLFGSGGFRMPGSGGQAGGQGGFGFDVGDLFNRSGSTGGGGLGDILGGMFGGAAVATAQDVQPRGEASPAELPVYGGVLLLGATSAARQGRAGAATELLGEAAETADRAWTGRTDYEILFGPSNVVMQSVDCSVIAEDYVAAAQMARRMPRDSALAVGGPVSAFDRRGTRSATPGPHPSR